jgi:signal transduction histidine kinase
VTRNRSLTFRLIAHWIAASFLVFFTLPVTVYIPATIFSIGINADTKLEGWAAGRAFDIVSGALAKAPDGSLFIKRTEALRSHERRNPEFRFAAIETRTGILLPGSSTELMAFFAQRDRIEFVSSLFHLIDDSNQNARGYARTTDTAYGRMMFIVYGSYFHLDDWLYTIYIHFTTQSVIVYLMMVTVVALVGYVSVRRGLAPLRFAVAQAASIDANSLHQRIQLADLPSEVAPLVDAMNRALERVDAGVARQKRFLANAAHELRTPITILCAHVENPDKSTFEEDIKKGVYRVRTLVEQLLSAARLSNQKGMIHQDVDLGKSVLATILDYMPLAIDSGRDIELDSPPSAVIVRANSWALESVLTNLIENAVRAEPSGGTVLVRVLPGATIEVIDHGEGVAPKDREAIFEPFWRKNDATRGTGLGLAITRELVDKHGGRIWVEETPGGGATFKLSFPAIR